MLGFPFAASSPTTTIPCSMQEGIVCTGEHSPEMRATCHLCSAITLDEPIFTREIFLHVLDVFIQEYETALSEYINRNPLAPARHIPEKPYLLSLAKVSSYFRSYLLPIIFRSFVFHGPHHLKSPNSKNQSQKNFSRPPIPTN